MFYGNLIEQDTRIYAMTDSIEKNLLDLAKQHLASNDFKNAAKSAKAVLALDSLNSDATDILKASEAVIGNGSSNDESVTKTELKLIAVQVQAAINSVEWAKAEDLITQYLVKYPDIPDATKILQDVQKARGKYNLHRGQMQRKRVEDDTARARIYNEQEQEFNQAAMGVVGVILTLVVL